MIKRHPSIWLTILAIILVLSAVTYHEAIADHPSHVNTGYWAELAETNPRGWDCMVWVNRGDRDVTLLWCDDDPPKRKGEKRSDD